MAKLNRINYQAKNEMAAAYRFESPSCIAISRKAVPIKAGSQKAG
jgi:hypothetical protein